MTKNFDIEIKTHDDTFCYMLLYRMQTDCLYFLGNGNGCTKYLWAENINDQIDDMQLLFDHCSKTNTLSWITAKDINIYAIKMHALEAAKCLITN